MMTAAPESWRGSWDNSPLRGTGTQQQGQEVPRRDVPESVLGESCPLLLVSVLCCSVAVSLELTLLSEQPPVRYERELEGPQIL